MKKEEKSPLTTSKDRWLYKYELQATNQILKDTNDTHQPFSLLTSQENSQNNFLNELFSSDLFNDNKRYQDHQPKMKCELNLSKDQDVFGAKKQKQVRQKKKIQKTKMNEGEVNISLFYQSDEEFVKNQQDSEAQSAFPFNNQVKGKQANRRKPNYYTKNQDHEPSLNSENSLNKTNKRQKRGLANISLKVKNIVAKKGFMTFKEVSNEVLNESLDDLPMKKEEREKQIKNIRRRVYDALNVLVAVQILKKKDNFVMHTQFTNIPGKKLSAHWDTLTEKNKILKDLEENYKRKLANLQLLKKKIELVQLLHLRNSNAEEQLKQSLKEVNQNNLIDFSQKRYQFPLIFFIPPKNNSNKITVQIEYEDNSSQKIKKFIIEDLLKYLDLQSTASKKQIENKKDEINKQSTAEQKNEQLLSICKQKQSNQSDDIYRSD